MTFFDKTKIVLMPVSQRTVKLEQYVSTAFIIHSSRAFTLWFESIMLQMKFCFFLVFVVISIPQSGKRTDGVFLRLRKLA